MIGEAERRKIQRGIGERWKERKPFFSLYVERGKEAEKTNNKRKTRSEHKRTTTFLFRK